MLTSSLPVKTGQALVEWGFQDAPTKQVLGHSILDDLHCRISGGRDVNAATNGFLFGEEDSSLKLSSSLLDPSLLIDLKLGRLVDQRDGHSSRLAQGAPILYSSESTTPSKRCRIFGVGNQIVYCQVYGCNKDLSSSKEYHKRHKVCEVHSKTPKVIVNGIEQRFCQQCSRFHLLCEFDDVKRSCRKRLAGHNKRRRKPQVGFHSSGRASRFSLPFNDCNFHGMNDLISHIRLEDRTNNGPLPLSSYQYQDLYSRLPFSSHSTEELCYFQDSNRDSSTTVCMFNNITRNLSPLFNKGPSLGSDEFGTMFDTESPIRGLSGISEPGCARSLLSPQSQNSSTHTSGIPMDQSLSPYSINQVSDNLVVNGESSRFLSSAEGSQAGPAVVSDGDLAGFEISDKLLHGLGFSNTKDYHFGEEMPTIDLLQLSYNLQQVERERQFMKLEFDSV